MIYYLAKYLSQFDIPGIGMFNYISFRTGATIITALLISMLTGKRIIKYLKRKQIGEEVRNLGLEGQMQKSGTPTMGGIIILIATLAPVLLFADIKNIYVIIMLVSTAWLGMIGFADDYIKVFKKRKAGLSGKLKVLGQIILGLFVGITMYLSPDIVVREKTSPSTIQAISQVEGIETGLNTDVNQTEQNINSKTTKTTIPFFKNNEFDYKYLVPFKGKWGGMLVWVVFVIAVIFIVTAVSNGANLTDGLDGLATGVSAIIGTTLGIFAYVGGHIVYADYLNIMYLPGTGELVVFMGAFIGAAIGFLWYNSYPAQVFMGDTGSLAIGGMIAIFAILIRKELLIPILCGIFFVEALSVMIQVSHFKRTKRKYGVGRRVFLMSPLHHHYQKKGYPEPKIVVRFWIVGVILAVITVVTLKIR